MVEKAAYVEVPGLLLGYNDHYTGLCVKIKGLPLKLSLVFYK